MFDGEFSLVKQNEISQSLQTFCIANTVIRDIGILYPRKGVVITPHGWFEQQEYQSFVNDQLLIDGESFLNTVAEMPGGFARLYPDDFAEADPNNLVYISQLDVLESPRAVAIIYLDKSVISEQAAAGLRQPGQRHTDPERPRPGAHDRPVRGAGLGYLVAPAAQPEHAAEL